jgi:hypothetical protein
MTFLLSSSSCLYKAGNRQPDVNYRWNSSVSPYYIKKYLAGLDSSYANRAIITSEIVNFPENFIPITDSANALKFVIEFSSLDSVRYLRENVLTLSSIYDFKKMRWVLDRDSLQDNELGKFKRFMEATVMPSVLGKYQGRIQDSFLFIDHSRSVSLTPL